MKGMIKKPAFCPGDRKGKRLKIENNFVEGRSQSWPMLSIEEMTSSLEAGKLLNSRLSVENFASILNNCKKEKNAGCALRLRAYMEEKGMDGHKLLGNCLVSLLVEVEHIREAQKVFNKLRYRSECSWNCLIRGYDKSGDPQHALNLYSKMLEDSIHPSGYTFVALLKACVKLKDVQRGQDLHVEIARRQLETNVFVGSTLVDMYGNFGLVEKAQKVFDNLSSRNSVSWTALISGYAKHGHGKKALDLFERMKGEGITPDPASYVCALKACGSIGVRAADTGRELHRAISRKALERNPVIGNALVDMYAKCGLVAKAQEIFDKLSVKNAVAWTALIAGYAQHGQGEEALDCFEQMQCKGVLPDAATYVCSLKACGIVGAMGKAQELHAEAARKGLDLNSIVGNTLVDMYANFALPTKAQEVFDKLLIRDKVSWTSLIGGYANQGKGKEALQCFRKMQCDGIPPEASTYVFGLKACGSINAIDKGRKMHAAIKQKCLEGNPLIGNALVDMYAKCGFLAKAHKIFDNLPARDVVSWTALIVGYTQLGETENVLRLFEEMQGGGVTPNLVTFLSLLNACNHAGLVEKGFSYLEAMEMEYGINPGFEHYACVVDLLGRAGQFEKAVSLIRKMPFTPTFVIWFSILGSCQKWGNVELGRVAFENAVRLDEQNPAAYVCMANIYANAGMEEKAGEIELMRLKNQALE